MATRFFQPVVVGTRCGCRYSFLCGIERWSGSRCDMSTVVSRVRFPVPGPPPRVLPCGGRLLKICGGHGPGETPGPIPNPEAKAWHGDGTALDRVWESSAPPHYLLWTPVEPHGSRGSVICKTLINTIASPMHYFTPKRCASSNKIMYHDKMRAQQAADQSLRERGAELWVYRCEFCGHWHLTHHDPNASYRFAPLNQERKPHSRKKGYKPRRR